MPSRSNPKITSTAEFARYVGLARTTVSRVINNQPGLRPETIARVHQAMAEVGFSPNPYAVYLLRGQTRTVGVCLRHMDAPATYDKFFALQQELQARGFKVIIEGTHQDFTNTERILRHFMIMRVEAVVMLGGFEPDQIDATINLLKPQAVPVIFADQFVYPGQHTLLLDRSHAMEELVVHLHGLGHRQIGLLGIRLNFLFNDSRIRGIQRGLERCKLDFESTIVLVPAQPKGSRSYAFGRRLAECYLELPLLPTAFLALNDEVAIGAMWRFQEAGLAIPRDLSLTGFNNLEIASHVTPSLTSVDHRGATVMAHLSDMIVRILSQPRKRALHQVLLPEVVYRHSTGPVPEKRK